MSTPYHELRKKYPKWAHRRDERRKRRRKRRRSKKKSARQQAAGGSTTEGMLLSLLQQLMLGGTLAKKHGENVVTGYADKVTPDSLAPVRSRAAHRQALRRHDGDGGGAGAGAAAAIGYMRDYGPPAFPREEGKMGDP